MDVLGVS